jgi:hypothetical protein
MQLPYTQGSLEITCTAALLTKGQQLSPAKANAGRVAGTNTIRQYNPKWVL